METNNDYQEIGNSVSTLSVQELIDEFNALVGNHGWTSARAAHDTALIKSLIEKGIDVSAVYDGKAISFEKKIALNNEGNKVIIA